MSHPLLITATVATKIVKLYLDGKILDEQMKQLDYAHEVIDTKIANRIQVNEAKLDLFKTTGKSITKQIYHYFEQDNERFKLDYQRGQKLKHLYDICDNETIKRAIENELCSHVDQMIDKTANLGFLGGFLKNTVKLIG